MSVGWVFGLAIGFVLGTRVQSMASKKEDSEDAVADDAGKPSERRREPIDDRHTPRLKRQSEPTMMHLQVPEGDSWTLRDNRISSFPREKPCCANTRKQVLKEATGYIEDAITKLTDTQVRTPPA
jgi:hypothetical protein